MWRVGFILFCIFVKVPVPADCTTDQSDVSALSVLFSTLNSAAQLTGWTSNNGDPCAQSWKGITCSGTAVTEVKLSGLGLTGSLGYNLDKLTSLINFDVSNNNIGLGNQIPYALPPHVQRLDLSGNSFGGGLPYSISQMSSLTYLNVGRNQLQGALVDMFRNLPTLSFIDLSNNNFLDNLPRSFSNISSLTTLYLQNNQFTGPIDVLANLPLADLNIANNHFTGWIPDELRRIKNLQTDGNSWNSGPSPPSPPYTSPTPGQRINPDQLPASNSNPSGSGGGNRSGVGGGGIAGIIISILIIGSVMAFFFIKRKQNSSSKKENLDLNSSFQASTNQTDEMKSIQITFQTKAVPPAPVDLKSPPVEWPKSFDHDDDTLNKAIVQKTNTNAINASVYSVADLQMATGSFSVENLVGEGFIGSVYRAEFDDGKVLAVKKINSSLSAQTSEGFMEMVSNISQLHHPNVAELVGYCSEHGQHLLLYEFYRNGSLHDFLHLSDEYCKPLTWNTRVLIALGAARALEYLHEVCSPSMVHKNFKSANILLDLELNPHISDCGITNLVPDTEYQAFNQDLSSGYSAPEVVMSGQYTMQSDVYSFGIVMLELLTGRKPFESSRKRSEQSLVRWATPQLHDIDALDKMVDPALKGLYPAKSLSRFADIIAICIQSEPEFRPPMSEVVQALIRLVQRANMNKRMGSLDEKEASRHVDDVDMQDIF